LLRELGEWIDVRKRTPFFAYVTTTDPRQDGEAATGYVRHYAQRQRAELEAEAEAEAAAAGGDGRGRTGTEPRPDSKPKRPVRRLPR
jgi:hypothetical protein